MTSPDQSSGYVNRPGYDELWGWFGLSYASFAVLPRVMMHEMPDEWQAKMAELLEQFDERWPQHVDNLDGCRVSVVKDGRFVSMPPEITNYRHPDRAALAKYGPDLRKRLKVIEGIERC